MDRANKTSSVTSIVQGEKCRIDTTCAIFGLEASIKIGNRVILHRSSTVDATGGTITIGDGTIIFPYAMLMTYSGVRITIGADCTVNPFTVLYGHGGLTIGNFVRIATHTVIVPANHIFADRDVPITKQGLSKLGVVIEDDVWIGAHVTILDGVTVGRGSVIAAGAVVNANVEPYSIVGGLPAKVIGQRS